MELTRAATDSAEIVIASRFLVDVFIDLLNDPYEDKLTRNRARSTPFLAFKFHESKLYAIAAHIVCSGYQLRVLDRQRQIMNHMQRLSERRISNRVGGS